MTTTDSLDALRRTNPHARVAPDLPTLAHDVRTRISTLPGSEPEATAHRVAPAPGRRPWRIAAMATSAAAIAVVVAMVAMASPDGDSAAAAVEEATATTAEASAESGTAVVTMTVGGRAWAGKTVQWHGDDVAITDADGAGRPAPFTDDGPGQARGMRVVDGVLYGPDPDHGWVNLGDPSHIDPDSGTTPAEIMVAIQEDVAGATLRRLADGMRGWTDEDQADGSTVYRGTAAAGLVARETGFKEGETIRVLPFGYVAHDEAEDPSAPLDVAITVGADGLVREMAVAWGSGATAWTYTVAYQDLGTTAPIEAPTDAVSIEELRRR